MAKEQPAEAEHPGFRGPPASGTSTDGSPVSNAAEPGFRGPPASGTSTDGSPVVEVRAERAAKPHTITGAFAAAIAEAEALIANPPFDATDRERVEGYEYLAGSIRSAIQMAFDYDLQHPVLINPTHQYSRQGLDNPDAIYFNAYLDAGGSYLVTGRRGTTSDLSFQIMDGTYSADGAPGTTAAFDDRSLEIDEDGTFEWRFDCDTLGSTLIVREVFNDWASEERGTLRIQRLDTAGVPRTFPDLARIEKKYGVAAKLLISRIKTWFAFPEWFTYKEPVNTLTAPQSTPGGLASQFSSIGHYSLESDQALVVSVPVSDAPYQAIQIGNRWYASTDYEHHQTSLTAAQSVASGHVFRYVICEQNPGVANWLETLGHSKGVMMLRWQRLARELDASDGPSVEVVSFDSLASRADLDDQRVTPTRYADRIQARQVAVAKRMIS